MPSTREKEAICNPDVKKSSGEALNPSQQQAVEHVEGPLLILAGAGSGKTRVITYRIDHLVQQAGVDLQAILALTFTNKAAGEMKERVIKLLGPLGNKGWISTFHAACVRILRKDIDKLGYSRDFVIYDTDEQLSLVKQCMEELNINSDLYPAAGIAHHISRFKNQGLDLMNLSPEVLPFSLEGKALLVYPVLQKRLKESNALHFDDLLCLTIRLFEQYPQVLAQYQTRFRHILVDEYQDTNPIQYQFLKLLTRTHQNICVVGDDDQSIYRWRGADIRNILDFEKDFPGARVIKLEENYRSTQTILEAAEAVVEQNKERKAKKLWTRKGPGGKILYFRAMDETEEANYLCGTLTQLKARGTYRYQDGAIFYRTNAQSRVIEEALRRHDIPYRVVGGVRFYDRREIRDILAYLRLLINPQDSLSLKRILNVPPRGLGRVTLNHIGERAESHSLCWLEAIRALAEEDGLPSATREKLRRFLVLLDQLAEKARSLPTSRMIEEVVRLTGYETYLVQEGRTEAESRRQNIQELISAAQELEERSPEAYLGEFLDQASLSSPEDISIDQTERVTLMTLHSSKGLEFPVVFICGMENHLIPHTRSMESPSELEEERRLCYVGMTRAQELLYLTNAVRRKLYGTEVRNPPSLFLEAIPPDRLQVVQSTPASPNPGSSPGQALERKTVATSPIREKFGPGIRVHHAKWGVGVVKEADGEGDHLKLTVFFQKGGEKRLAAKYAGLKLV